MSSDPKVRLLRPENFHAAESPPQPEAFQRHGDGDGHGPYDGGMTSPSREEIDAKLEAIEARMDARIATTLGKMEAFMAAADGREVVNQERFQKATADNATNRSILVGGLLTIVVTVVSVYFALKADNQALINNLITATNTGAANGEFKATATNDIKKLQEDLAKKQDKK